MPYGTTLDLSANSNTVVVGLMFFKFKCFIVYVFIAAPKSIKVFGTKKLLIEMVTIGIPGLTYFSMVVFVDMRLAKLPMTWIVVDLFFFYHIS